MGFKIPDNRDKVEIPFEFNNNLILLNVVFDQVFPLKFIFDTGSENTILAKREFADLLQIEYQRQFQIYGADMERTLTAYLARGIDLDLPGLTGSGLDILVLEEDYFHFEEYTGLKVHGILGMDLFKIFTIQVDYKKKVLTLYRIDNFQLPSKKFKALDAEIFRGKPYIYAETELQDNTKTPIKLLIDTGANLALLLHNNSSEAISLPEQLVPGKIGNGLGGFLEGYLGRVRSLSFDEFYFNNVVSNFQELNDQADSIYTNERNGILGNEILSRFKVIFDLSREKIYFRPEKKYNRGFKFDKSGLTIIASGEFLNEFSVKDIISDSPAAEAGMQKGDKIKSINFMPASIFDLKGLTDKLQKRTGKRIRLIIERDGVKQKVVFRLRDLI